MEKLVRDYRKGDESSILELFEKVFNEKLGLKTWKWRFLESPFGKGIIKLLYDGTKLAGHYAVIPMQVKVNEEISNGVFSMTTMTHPEYRGRGIFPLLGEETYKEAAKRGFDFVFGFPNENSYGGFIKKLKWTGFGNMRVWQRKINDDGFRIEITKNKYVREISEFDAGANILWEKVKHNYSVIIPRTMSFLNWRFVQNPGVEYTKYIISDYNKGISGYAVLKIWSSRDERKGHIVDLLSVNNDKIIATLLEYAFTHFAKHGVTEVSCWSPENCYFTDLLKERGFSLDEMKQTFFGVRIFDKTNESFRALNDISNWYLTMGDSDVF